MFIEKIGVSAGIAGAVLMALKLALLGYVGFFVSSALLSFTAYRNGQTNLLKLQIVFFWVNLFGLFNYAN